jgi:ssDNA-binding Zn-finger/Zn-ribbon topoisomerase 1
MSKSDLRGLKSDPTDATDAQITGPHLDADATGDLYEYFRCTDCGLESSDPRLETKGCPRCNA